MNLPSELSETGTVSHWDWETAIENLTKVSKLDVEVVPMDSTNSCDFSNLELDETLKINKKKIINKRRI